MMTQNKCFFSTLDNFVLHPLCHANLNRSKISVFLWATCSCTLLSERSVWTFCRQEADWPSDKHLQTPASLQTFMLNTLPVMLLHWTHRAETDTKGADKCGNCLNVINVWKYSNQIKDQSVQCFASLIVSIKLLRLDLYTMGCHWTNLQLQNHWGFYYSSSLKFKIIKVVKQWNVQRTMFQLQYW